METTKRKYRILHIVGSLEVGGTEKWLVKLIRYWNSDIFEPIVIAFKEGELKAELIDLGVEPIILKKEAGHHLKFLYQLLTKFNQLNPNLVHCRNALPAVIYGGIAAKMARLPLVVSIHGRPPPRNSFENKLWYRVQNYSDKIITVSNSIKDSLITLSDIKSRKITVIHNGIDSTQIGCKSKESKKEELGLDSSLLIIGCVGTLSSVKGHKYLIQAAPLILKKFPNVRFILVGDGPLRSDLEQLAKELNVKDTIMFLGYRRDVYELMPIFDIFVLPSLSEGLSNVLLEAMAAQKPIVATNVGGNPEVVEDGRTGILVPPQDSQSLAKAIISLLSNEKERNNVGKLGFLKIEHEFQLDKTVRKYEDIYLKVIEKRK